MVKVHVSNESDGDDTGIRISSPLQAIIADMEEIPTFRHVRSRDSWDCFIEARPVPMMWVIQSLYSYKERFNASVDFDADAKKRMMTEANKVPRPSITAVNGRVVVHSPHASLWDSILRRVNVSGSSSPKGALVPVSNVRSLMDLNNGLPEIFRMSVDDEVMDMVNAPLPSPFNGTDASLRKVPLEALEYVRHDAQAWSDRKANPMKTGDKLRALGFESLHDLLVSPPMRYIDRSNPQDVRELLDGEHATIVGTISDIAEKTPRLTIVTITDRNGSDIECQYFNVSKWIKRTYKVGDEVIVNGVYKPFITARGEYPRMQHPTIDFADSSSSPVIPVYHQSQKYGVSNWMMTSCIDEIVDRIGKFKGQRWLEDALMQADIDTDVKQRMPYGEALKKMHKPATMEELNAASRSLAFCELVEMLTIIESRRKGGKVLEGVGGRPDGSLTNPYLDALPYQLTDAQSSAVDSIDKGMSSDAPMHALLVGDVGSGKTTVIHMSALKSIEEGHQAVICAPTGILAMQLYDVFMSIYANMDEKSKSRIHPLLLVHYKGKGATARRREALKSISDGSANLVFGTHAVLSEELEWHDIGFVGIDEQHKFGAWQRSVLLHARRDGKVPDMLMQTATPIPRSIAQVYYGDVKYLRLDQMPSGRLPIRTEWLKCRGAKLLEDRGNPIWSDIRDEARKGHGTFIICPMVDESPKMEAASVKRTYAVVESLMSAYGITCSMVYGSQNEDEQHQSIDDFKSGRTQILVASSVVEVGVSCEHASRMVILDANRFGLASLHQIRGRIGRGNIQSVCYLVGVAYTQSATNRMEAITSTLDGWKLSKADLKNRGTGTLLQDSQSGSSDFMYADLVDNADWIEEARRMADMVLDSKHAKSAIRDSMKWFGMSSKDSILS